MSLFHTFFAADLMGKLIILVLLSSSCYSIAIIFKYGYFFYLHDQLGENLKLYIPKIQKIARINTEPSMYLDLYDQILNIYASFNNREKSDEFFAKNSEQLDKLVDDTFLKWEISIQRDIDNISIIGSIAPFVGLLGTVLGIMNSFQAIAKANSNSITIVAPALSEALLVTALGIFVAIPANVAANYFYSKLDHTKKDLQLFKKFLLDNFHFKAYKS